MPLDAKGRCEVDDKDADHNTTKDSAKDRQFVEARQGFELWRSITRVVCLAVNVRAPGLLSRLQSEMRAGAISDERWDL